MSSMVLKNIIELAQAHSEHYYSSEGTAESVHQWRAEQLMNLVEDILVEKPLLTREQRNRYCSRLADWFLKDMDSKEILEACPDDYGSEITDAHRSFIWDQLFDSYSQLSDVALYEAFQDLHNRKYNGF